MHIPLLKKILSVVTSGLFLLLAVHHTAYASPVITNIEIRNIGYTSVTIAWKTDIPTNSQISYGDKSADAFKSPASSAYDTDHSITLTSLRPATKYTFIVTSATEDGLSITSDAQQFSTLSFLFEDDIGTFGSINATPTPTPYTNPYAQYLPQNTVPSYNLNQPQPLYIVPPIMYQQPQQTTGQTLGDTDTQQTSPTTQPSDSIVLSIIQSSIWGVVIIFGVLMVVLVLLFNQLMKNRKELHELQQQLLKTNTETGAVKEDTEPERKVYRFDVRS